MFANYTNANKYRNASTRMTDSYYNVIILYIMQRAREIYTIYITYNIFLRDYNQM